MSSSLDSLRSALNRAGVRSALSDNDLNEILSSPGASTSSERDSSSNEYSGATNASSSHGASASGYDDSSLSLPSELLAELASPQAVPRAAARFSHSPTVAVVSDFATTSPRSRAPLPVDLRFECVKFHSI